MGASVVELVAAARAVGVHLRLAEDGGVRAAMPDTPEATEAIAALRAIRSDVRLFLQNEAEVPVPAGTCGCCGAPLSWVPDWPMPGQRAWLCATCSQQPTSSLQAVFDSLTAEERRRWDVEYAGGDRLATRQREVVAKGGVSG